MVTNTLAYFGQLKIVNVKSFIVQVVAEFKTYQRIFFNHMFESFGGTLGVVEWDLK